MTMACNPIDRPLADPIPSDHAGGHHWSPSDFKSPTKQADPEHLDRLGLLETQIDGTHYLGRAMQPWQIIEAWDLDFFEGSVLKYLLRRKPGVPRAIDLRKARHYLDKCIAREEAKT